MTDPIRHVVMFAAGFVLSWPLGWWLGRWLGKSLARWQNHRP